MYLVYVLDKINKIFVLIIDLKFKFKFISSGLLAETPVQGVKIVRGWNGDAI